MSASEARVRVAILTVSDSTVAGTREDESGPALAAHCTGLGWPVVARMAVADESDRIEGQLRKWVQASGATLILTTGGTGVAARDVTPEATRKVLQTELPGVGELMRSRGLEQTPLAVLSRATAGTCGRTMIVNLPGAPAGAVHSLQAIAHLVHHVVNLLAGNVAHEPVKETQEGMEASEQ